MDQIQTTRAGMRPGLEASLMSFAEERYGVDEAICRRSTATAADSQRLA